MSKLIPLTRGYSAIVDDEDHDYLMQWKWYVFIRSDKRTPYAVRNAKYTPSGRGVIMMHRLLFCPLGDGVFVDHINRNGLDNRKCNLRKYTKSENAANAQYKSGLTSRFRGVCWFRETSKWRAQIHMNRKKVTLGYFTNEIDAARAYDRAAINQWGEFAIINFADPQVVEAIKGDEK